MANYRENNFYWASDLHFYSVTSHWSNSVQNLRDGHTENDFYEYSSRRPTRNSLARRQSNVPTLMMCWNWNSSRNNTGRDGREQRGAPRDLMTMDSPEASSAVRSSSTWKNRILVWDQYRKSAVDVVIVSTSSTCHARSCTCLHFTSDLT